MRTQYIKAFNILLVFITSMIFSVSVLAKGFGGSWVLADTGGKPFQIHLEKDGAASGTHGDSMKHGTWEEKDGTAIIHWGTGWTTVITKEGGHYIKKAFKPGDSITDAPTNTSDAKRK